MKTVLSFDMGASNGRVVSISFDGKKIHHHELHRFSNEVLQEDGHFFWDFDYLFSEVKKGIEKAENVHGTNGLAGIGFDTWGVDFGIVDEEGRLLKNPFSYRDTHTVPMMEKALKQQEAFDLFRSTGNEISSINTLFQLMAIEERYAYLLGKAKHILMLPNLFQFFLTGTAVNEFTISSTSQLMASDRHTWNQKIIDRFFQQPLPLADIQLPHQIIGHLSGSKTPVILTPGHDTACALSALPIRKNHAYFISVGTWALVGKEVEKPVLEKEAFLEGFTNEGTSEGRYRFQKNGMGFWILQELRKEWKKANRNIDYALENEMLRRSTFSCTYIDPDDGLFFNPNSMEDAIQRFCLKTDQKAPGSPQEMLRCVIESMALKYAYTIERMEELTKVAASSIHIGGGGIQNRFLCQFIANATGLPVIAGPIEASSIGNGLSQLRALGEIASMEEGRAIVADSYEPAVYDPQDKDGWGEARAAFQQYIVKEEWGILE